MEEQFYQIATLGVLVVVVSVVFVFFVNKKQDNTIKVLQQRLIGLQVDYDRIKKAIFIPYESTIMDSFFTREGANIPLESKFEELKNSHESLLENLSLEAKQIPFKTVIVKKTNKKPTK